jgi:hypothetical protein
MPTTAPTTPVFADTSTPDTTTTSTSHGTSPLVYLGFTVAGVGVVAGSILGGLAFAKASSVSSECTGLACPKSADGDIQDGRSFANISTISFAVAGAGLVTGVIGLFLGGGSSHSSQARGDVSPWVGPGSVGLRGAF